MNDANDYIYPVLFAAGLAIGWLSCMAAMWLDNMERAFMPLENWQDKDDWEGA